MGSPLLAVLFDWDGTLLDSAEASYRCYVRLFRSYGLDYDRAAFGRTYSPNWYRTYLAVGLPETAWAEADARWLAFYAEEASRLLPGAREALLAVGERGLRRGLVTSGDRQRVARELVLHDLEQAFAAVVCADDARMKKPHPEPLQLALDRLGVAAGEAAYVGDSPEDVEMARAAGVRSVGIPGGFPNREALRASAPDVWAESLGEAVAALAGGVGRPAR
jgi:HAD superfamily hydrolase (TIGR01509 family)